MCNVAGIGIHTIIWGPTPKSFTSILDLVRRAGFKGVELFQHPSHLRREFADLSAFRSALVARDLRLLGACSGTLEERVQFCDEVGVTPVYLYVDDWDPNMPEALDKAPLQCIRTSTSYRT
jgi:sugar phosphate isomerase/epimerase